MEDNNRAFFKKFLFCSLGAIIIILFFSWLWHYLHTGKIVITTNSPYSTVSLSKISDSNTSSTGLTVARSKGKLSSVVTTGDYFATVEINSQESIQLIKLSSHKTLRYEINPVKSTGVEPVVYQNASNISASDQKLQYIDTASGHLSEINSQNKVSTQNSTLSFEDLDWADSSFGVGQGTNGHLYTINNGRVSALNVPFSYDGSVDDEDSDISFAVTPSRQVFVSDGGVVYAQNQSGGFKQIYQSSASSLALTAGTNYLSVTGQSLDSGESSQKSKLVVISTSTYQQLAETNVATIASGEADASAWSPSGQYLTFPGRSSLVIYDSSLRPVSSLPVNPMGVTWLDNNTFFYSFNDELWRYSLGKQRADLIANMPQGSLISGLTISSSKSYVYLATTSSGIGSSSAIRRVGLQNQTVPDAVYQLQSILPLEIGSCNMSLVNFTKPTVLISSPAGQTLQCQQSGKTELQSRGFNLNTLQFSLSSFLD